MTCKDYELIAGALKAVAGGGWDRPTVEATVDVIADALERDNPRFNRTIFVAASGA